VEDKVGNGMREAIDVAFGQFSGQVFYAGDWIDACALAAEKFYKRLRDRFDLSYLRRRVDRTLGSLGPLVRGPQDVIAGWLSTIEILFFQDAPVVQFVARS
jgi:hypothetical protein